MTKLFVSTMFAAAALAIPATAQDAGAELSASLGAETNTMQGLTGPTEGSGLALTTTRTLDAAVPIPALDGYLMRSRYIIVGPEGRVALHSHAERPAISYIVNGSILEMRSANDAPVRRGAGDFTLDADIAQWWYNDGTEPVLIFVSDLCPDGSDPACQLDPISPGAQPVFEPAGDVSWPDAAGTTTMDGFDGPKEAVGVTSETLGTIDLAAALSEVSELGDLDGLELRARLVTVEPDGILPLHVQPNRPNYFVVTKGELTYYGKEGTLKLAPTQTFEDFGPQPTWYRNEGDIDMQLFAIDVVSEETKSGG